MTLQIRTLGEANLHKGYQGRVSEADWTLIRSLKKGHVIEMTDLIGDTKPINARSSISYGLKTRGITHVTPIVRGDRVFVVNW